MVCRALNRIEPFLLSITLLNGGTLNYKIEHINLGHQNIQ